MSKLVLTSHGIFCEELKKSVEMIFGPQEEIYTLALLPEEGEEDYVAKFEAIKAETAGEQLVVFADLLGGTPCNQISKYVMQGEDSELYSGMNMPMVISYLNAGMTGQPLNIIEEGPASIKRVNDLVPKLG